MLPITKIWFFMSKNRRFIFLKDRLNKFSIRALLVALEKFFPEIDYEVIDTVSVYEKKIENAALFFSFNSVNFIRYASMATEIRKNCPENILVCGGSHPSARPNEMLKYFDAVCVGEGEYVIADIIEKILHDVVPQGVLSASEKVNLNEFDCFPKKVKMFGAVEIMRGCPFRCNYCQTPNLYPGRIRFRSIDSILKNVETAFSSYKKDYRFITPDAASYLFDGKVNTHAIETLLKGIKNITGEPGRIFFGSFPSELNPYFINEDLVGIIKKYCANKRVVIGLQTASKTQLKNVGRRDDIETVEKSIELLIKYGFNVDVDFIFGLPFETEGSLAEIFDWILKWQNRVRIHSHYFMPLPGSSWEYESPSTIPENYSKLIKQLEGKGRIFGQWCIQSSLSAEIYSCFRGETCPN